MTEEEHHARALLLQAEYKAYMNCYVQGDYSQLYSPNPVGETWLDADTLEEIPQHEKIARLLGAIGDGYGQHVIKDKYRT